MPNLWHSQKGVAYSPDWMNCQALCPPTEAAQLYNQNKNYEQLNPLRRYQTRGLKTVGLSFQKGIGTKPPSQDIPTLAPENPAALPIVAIFSAEKRPSSSTNLRKKRMATHTSQVALWHSKKGGGANSFCLKNRNPKPHPVPSDRNSPALWLTLIKLPSH